MLETKHILPFSNIDKSSLSLVGGKSANLGELTKAGFNVPNGFCVTTEAFKAFIKESEKMQEYYIALEKINASEMEKISSLGHNIREYIVSCEIPGYIKHEIETAWQKNGTNKAYAVRSSATAEDLPSASFAGQQDTYLNVIGLDNIIADVRRCWASLFTDRAIVYRCANNFNHEQVLISVVIQEMVFPDASGVMFTADVVNGNRKVVCIDASFGLGEAIVSGMVSADMYRIKNEKIIETKISDKKIAIYSVPTGGTVTRDLDEEQRHKQVLKDNEIIALSQVGLSIQKHYGIPQDIEWCLVGNEIFIVQSRPITSLYPLPPKSDNRYHIYSSFGHMQMMTDPMKPLGLSTIRTVVPIGNRDEPYGESTAFVDIGNRLYIDWTDYLYRPIGKIASVLVSNADERASNAVREAGETPEYKANQKSGSIVPAWNAVVYAVTFFSQVFLNLFVRDRSHVVEETNAKVSKILAVHGHYDSYEGEEKVRQIQHHLSYFFPTLLCSIAPAMFAGIISMRITESLVKKWLGDAVNPSLLNKGLRGNITTEMGLRVGDLADIARQHPQLVEFLESTTTLDGIEQVDGGIEFKEELDDFLAVHGCRGPGEIDITRTRWSEDPMLFVPSIIGQVKGLNHGEHRIKHEQGAKEAEQTEATILDLVRRTRFGYIKSLLLSRTLHVYRNSVGVREHPKFTIVTIFGRIRNAILEMADELVERDIINDRSDIFYFRLEEIAALVGDRYNFDAKARVEERREQYERNKKLAPPRVMNSDGEIFNGARKDVIVPEGAIAGLAVSAGIVEGVARVMQTPNDSTFLPGEILVAPYTDPAWTTLFNSAAGLITEVGGLLTHGSVVAREYGIPAVVGIDNATTLIKTGDRIFLDGTTGYIKILPSK